ncbi:MAG TPA: tetratricopeptide repeat protein [Candidatus Eisenbacteria bacterium]
MLAVVLLGAAGALAWPGLAKMWRAQVQSDWYERARGNESQGNNMEAARDYLRAEQAGLATPEFYTRWAVLERDTRHGFAAEAHFIRALEIDPTYGPARANLAELYRRRGWLAQAAQQFALAATVLPDSTARLYVQAGVLYEELNSRDRALDMYRNALAARRGYLPALEGLLRLGEPMPDRLGR